MTYSKKYSVVKKSAPKTVTMLAVGAALFPELSTRSVDLVNDEINTVEDQLCAQSGLFGWAGSFFGKSPPSYKVSGDPATIREQFEKLSVHQYDILNLTKAYYTSNSATGQDKKQTYVDALAIPTNKKMMPNSGLDRKIFDAAGPELRAHCDTLRRDHNGDICSRGEVVATPGFDLPVSLIFTVGPNWSDDMSSSEQSEALNQLSLCYEKIFKAAVDKNARRIALPFLCTGMRGMPENQAAEVAFHSALKAALAYPTFFDRIMFFTLSDSPVYSDTREAVYKEVVKS